MNVQYPYDWAYFAAYLFTDVFCLSTQNEY